MRTKPIEIKDINREHIENVLERAGLTKKTLQPKYVSQEITNETLHKIAREMGHRGGTTTSKRYGKEHYIFIGSSGATTNKKNRERLAKYDSFFTRHPELFDIMMREEATL